MDRTSRHAELLAETTPSGHDMQDALPTQDTVGCLQNRIVNLRGVVISALLLCFPSAAQKYLEQKFDTPIGIRDDCCNPMFRMYDFFHAETHFTHDCRVRKAFHQHGQLSIRCSLRSYRPTAAEFYEVSWHRWPGASRLGHMEHTKRTIFPQAVPRRRAAMLIALFTVRTSAVVRNAHALSEFLAVNEMGALMHEQSRQASIDSCMRKNTSSFTSCSFSTALNNIFELGTRTPCFATPGGICRVLEYPCWRPVPISLP
ncbi:uncharacterized protein CC84DRAFT_740570 [Paraphaeosphaeria sporulosa]|uniref:Uncharacterized protein n=1 Tax=Paraphaeosphaeria sporulosa TaxID=1460663 RepID=A0A177CF01_9PLEO|nr:uncharacterized protein CC84DRAFT_740570 [Paraphaeosphaeria sporulosa]OAG05916.1 hypothetical protein CC84DRAFT_740570 [Paraphaeosphaeria sporulosa]